MGKTVKGFGVRGQDRRKLRSELSGDFEGHKWFIRFERRDTFMWSIGKMTGYAGPAVGDVLRTMKGAAKAQDQLQEVYGESNIPQEAYNSLRLLSRWERMATKGRLTITGPHGSGDSAHYRVKIKQPT